MFALGHRSTKLRPSVLFLLLLPALLRVTNALSNHPIQVLLYPAQCFLVFLRRTVGELVELKLLRTLLSPQ
uniref:Putative secreted protein n=1 Tax=Anopheles darlingi TaxID=43151 RepID=A0A2M4DBC3_ANODA